jgi:hypothetical protein
LEDLRLIATEFLAANEAAFDRMVAQDELQEIKP